MCQSKNTEEALDGTIKIVSCIFNNDETTQKLLNNDINYEKALELIPEVCPINLKWLKDRKLMFNEDAEIGEDTCFWLDIMKDGCYLVGIDF